MERGVRCVVATGDIVLYPDLQSCLFPTYVQGLAIDFTCCVTHSSLRISSLLIDASLPHANKRQGTAPSVYRYCQTCQNSKGVLGLGSN